jgi:hypothetical protein
MPKRRIGPAEGLPMTILRLPKKEKYFRVANSVFNDQDLSWEARGVMGYLLSKPDNWQLRVLDLQRRGPAGQHKIRRILRELESARYLRRERFRRPDGTFGWFILIFEDPSLAKLVS